MSAPFMGAVLLDAVELVKDVGDVLLGDAQAVVDDGDVEGAVGTLQANAGLTAGRRVLEGVSHQVCQGALELARIAHRRHVLPALDQR